MNYSDRIMKRKIIKVISVCTVAMAFTFTGAMTHINADAEQQTPVNQVQEQQYTYRDLGQFKLYHYCPCVKCCGKSNGITATGTQATAGRTIAVDPKTIPLGSVVLIDDQEYIAEDVGGGIKGNTIDVFCNTHQEALNKGVRYTNIYLKESV